MIESFQTPSLAVVKAYVREQNVLLSAGERDEDIYYQAPLGRPLGPSGFLIYFHKTSQLLERLRLFGSIEITAQFSDGKTFSGALKIGEDLPTPFAAVLELHEEIEQMTVCLPHLFPLT